MRGLMLVLVMLGLVGCGAQAVAPVATQTVGTRQAITVGLGYIPDVQFAPFYVALQKGYYREAGFDVTFVNGQAPELLAQNAAGTMPFILVSGDEILSARIQGIPVKMVWQLYQRFPVVAFSKQATGITTPAQLKGQVIGVPGRYGATYFGLLALLQSAGLTENDVTIREIGFNQLQAVTQGSVPVAMGYSNNEPVRMQAAGEAVNVLDVGAAVPLVSNGLSVTEEYARTNADVISRFLAATTRGLQSAIDDPEDAFQQALKMEDLRTLQTNTASHPIQRQVLAATLAVCRTPATDTFGLGHQDPQAWLATYTFLRRANFLTRDTDPMQAFTNDFIVPPAAK